MLTADRMNLSISDGGMGIENDTTHNNTAEMELILRLANAAIQQRLPAIVFVASLSLVGIIGNIHVIALFPRAHSRTSTYTVFVIILSVVDLMTCLFQMPMEIYALTRPYTFVNETGCKVFRFSNSFLLLLSGLLLAHIAVDRYRRVSSPLKRQMTLSLCKKLVMVTVFVSLVLTSPMYVFTGKHTQIIQENGVNATGYKCFISDDMKGSKLTYGYLGLMFLIFLAITATLLFSYGAIVRVVFVRHASMRKSQNRTCTNSAEESTSLTLVQEGARNTSELFQSISVDSKVLNKTSTLKTIRPLILITAIFLIGFTPYLILQAIIVLDSDFINRFNNVQLTLYQFGFRLILLNNVCNPFVYGFTDAKFRTVVKAFYRCHK